MEEESKSVELMYDVTNNAWVLGLTKSSREIMINNHQTSTTTTTSSSYSTTSIMLPAASNNPSSPSSSFVPPRNNDTTKMGKEQEALESCSTKKDDGSSTTGLYMAVMCHGVRYRCLPCFRSRKQRNKNVEKRGGSGFGVPKRNGSEGIREDNIKEAIEFCKKSVGSPN